jgi:hypothetical protein
VDRHGKCPGCYADEDDQSRTEADVLSLWRNR